MVKNHQYMCHLHYWLSPLLLQLTDITSGAYKDYYRQMYAGR